MAGRPEEVEVATQDSGRSPLGDTEVAHLGPRAKAIHLRPTAGQDDLAISREEALHCRIANFCARGRGKLVEEANLLQALPRV